MATEVKPPRPTAKRDTLALAHISHRPRPVPMDRGQLDHVYLARAQEPTLHRGISHVGNARVLTVAVGSEIVGPARFSEHPFQKC